MSAATAGNIRSFVIANFLLGKEGSFKDDDSFLEQGIIDSTGILQLVSFLEENYSIEMTDDELVPDNLDSINRIVAYLGRKCASNGNGAVAVEKSPCAA